MGDRRARALRLISRLAVLLLLGAIVNVAVAWGIAEVTEMSTPNMIVIVQPAVEEGSWFVWLDRRWATCFVSASISHASSPSLAVTDSRIPAWSRLRHLPAYRQGDPMPVMIDHGVGWPALSMWYSIDSVRQWNVGTILETHFVGTVSDTSLPAQLIWPGFTVNTLFYAAILWLFIAGPFALRRRRRIRRGLCPACAYPVGQSEVCTECGKPVKPRSVKPASS